MADHDDIQPLAPTTVDGGPFAADFEPYSAEVDDVDAAPRASGDVWAADDPPADEPSGGLTSGRRIDLDRFASPGEDFQGWNGAPAGDYGGSIGGRWQSAVGGASTGFERSLSAASMDLAPDGGDHSGFRDALLVDEVRALIDALPPSWDLAPTSDLGSPAPSSRAAMAMVDFGSSTSAPGLTIDEAAVAAAGLVGPGVLESPSVRGDVFLGQMDSDAATSPVGGERSSSAHVRAEAAEEPPDPALRADELTVGEDDDGGADRLGAIARGAPSGAIASLTVDAAKAPEPAATIFTPDEIAPAAAAPNPAQPGAPAEAAAAGAGSSRADATNGNGAAVATASEPVMPTEAPPQPDAPSPTHAAPTHAAEKADSAAATGLEDADGGAASAAVVGPDAPKPSEASDERAPATATDDPATASRDTAEGADTPAPAEGTAREEAEPETEDPAGAADEPENDSSATALAEAPYPPAGPGVPADLGLALLDHLDPLPTVSVPSEPASAMPDDELALLEPVAAVSEAADVGMMPEDHADALDDLDADSDAADDGVSG